VRDANFEGSKLTDVSLKNVVIEDADVTGLVINGVRIDALLRAAKKD
jgi:uncharacterized protein YjbI with pentapeptide repeats